jgi:hypothetical protein
VSKIGSVFSVFSAKIFFSGRLFKSVPLRNFKKKNFFISPSGKFFFLIFKKIFYLFFTGFSAMPIFFSASGK